MMRGNTFCCRRDIHLPHGRAASSIGIRRIRGAGALALLAGMLCSNLFAASAFAAEPNPVVELTVANRGRIVIELYRKDAPKTVAHFLDLVKRRFYDGLLFHRVVPNFVVQTGDPASAKFTSQEAAAKDDHAGGTVGLGAGGSGPSGANANIPFESNP